MTSQSLTCTTHKFLLNKKSPFEYGVRPQESGHKKVLSTIAAAVKAGKTDLEILEEDPESCRYEKQINFLRFTYGEAASDRQAKGVKVIVIWGPTGAGKTFSAVNVLAKGVPYYICESPAKHTDKVWFNGYQGQAILILDDFAGEVCNLNFLKRLLDHYKMKVEFKGGFVWAQWTTVIITSQHPPSVWYADCTSCSTKPEDLAALARRITEVRHQTVKELYFPSSWDGRDTGDFIRYEEAPPAGAATPLLVNNSDTEDESS